MFYHKFIRRGGGGGVSGDWRLEIKSSNLRGGEMDILQHKHIKLRVNDVPKFSPTNSTGLNTPTFVGPPKYRRGPPVTNGD